MKTILAAANLFFGIYLTVFLVQILSGVSGIYKNDNEYFLIFKAISIIIIAVVNFYHVLKFIKER